MLTRLVLATKETGTPKQVVVSLMDEGMHGATLRREGVELHSLGMRWNMPSPRALVHLIRVLREVRPNIVMTWLYHADLMGTIAAPLANVPHLLWNLRCSEMDF